MALLPFEETERLVGSVVTYFRKRGVHADEREMKQDAWIGLLSASRRFNPAKGKPGPYLWRAAFLHLSKQLWKRRCPVTIRWYDFKVANETVCSISLNPLANKFNSPSEVDQNIMRFEGFISRQSITESIDEAVGIKLLRKQIAMFVNESTAKLSPTDRTLGLSVLSGHKPKEVADAIGIPVDVVYRSLKRVKRVLAKDSRIQQLSKESK
jgi:RNA polymerase sigma factor (sigma-70 family)